MNLYPATTEPIFAETMADKVEITMAKAVTAILEAGWSLFIEGAYNLRWRNGWQNVARWPAKASPVDAALKQAGE